MIGIGALVALVAFSQLAAECSGATAPSARSPATIDRPRSASMEAVLFRSRRDPHQNHKAMMHNHLSRKVFDRACAASKDTIDEIIACLTGNQMLLKAIKEDTAKGCYKEAFNENFDAKEVMRHKELICNNRDKFESMTTCIYAKTSEAMDAKEIEKMTEAMVDVGLCIINALDG